MDYLTITENKIESVEKLKGFIVDNILDYADSLETALINNLFTTLLRSEVDLSVQDIECIYVLWKTIQDGKKINRILEDEKAERVRKQA